MKRHFTEDGKDIVDVKIALHGYIEDTTIKDVIIKAHTRFAYEKQPRQAIIDMRGLVLIEVILFNVEKFLQDNTRRLEVE